MNIFVVSKCPIESAQMLCDKHVVKMILESAQLLSTAHRLIDGTLITKTNEKNRKSKQWVLQNHNDIIYHATHYNHPCSVWARSGNNNYNWLYVHFYELCKEYTFRYNKVHKTELKLLDILKNPPINIPIFPLTPQPLAMPDKYKSPCIVQSYRNYYLGEKTGFAKWTKRQQPGWFTF